ncbi:MULTISPECIES: hypothetical protein [Halorussus]|uniref:hypothetical protein n=1 Tax=Halorussus TaxID=1070314 RepID=UPI00209CA9D6|nr:hypothetical protein [Halorussus vallis]USZ76035.1 hypothetical protein NGM07_01625 [Halorussus vallis]
MNPVRTCGLSFRNRHPEAIALSSLFLALTAAHLWAALVVTYAFRPADGLVGDGPLSTFVLSLFLTHGLGLAVGAAALARILDIEVPLGPPAVDRLPAAAAVVSAPVLLVCAVAVTANVAFDASLATLVQTHYSPQVGPSFVVVRAFVPAAFAAVGYGLLFFGVVQQRLRALTGPSHATVLTTVVAGVYWVGRPITSSVTRFEPNAVPGFAATVLAGAAFCFCVGHLYRGAVHESLTSVLRVRYAPVFAVGLLALSAVLADLADPVGGTRDLLWVATFAVGAFGYERTRSVWVPVLALAALQFSVDVVALLEAILGVAPA